ncbi:MAG: putative sugar O-methyltransferase [Bacteroidetes bacterium]|nr:putative sugar O-methyltransferase [Bacteroidota bacterium]
MNKFFPRWISIPTSELDWDKRYKKICKLAYERESVFNTFRRLKYYGVVEAKMSKEQGQAFLDVIKKSDADLLKYFSRFATNEKYGNPVTFRYDVGEFSPVTLRYIKILSDIKLFFGNLNGFNIVEIGAGYGGQCKIISDVFDFYSYTIIDLDEALLLCEKYLTKFDLKNVYYLSPDEIIGDKECDLVISNYAFSECIKTVQDYYINKILTKSTRGYITYNYDKPFSAGSPYNKKEITKILSRKHTIRIIDEKPKTGPINFIITWDDTK